MKHIMLILCILGFSKVAAAKNSLLIPPDTVSIDMLSSAQMTTRDMCPPGVDCVVGGTIVTLTFDLPTCLDKLGPVNFRRVKDSKQITLYISAHAFINKWSPFVKCSSIQKSVEIALISDYAPINVEFADRLVNPDN